MAVANTASTVQSAVHGRSNMSYWVQLEGFYQGIKSNLPSRLKEDIYVAIHDLAQALEPKQQFEFFSYLEKLLPLRYKANLIKSESKKNPRELILTIKDNTKPKANIVYQSTVPASLDDEYDYIDGDWQLKPNDCYNSRAELTKVLESYHRDGSESDSGVSSMNSTPDTVRRSGRLPLRQSPLLMHKKTVETHLVDSGEYDYVISSALDTTMSASLPVSTFFHESSVNTQTRRRNVSDSEVVMKRPPPIPARNLRSKETIPSARDELSSAVVGFDELNIQDVTTRTSSGYLS
ncbi:hypothetical protein JQC92_00500 [Shewanella sp. 202IG2-18]|uniref:hypothetical protein n=1 Tax=Parashewanella hymeniacidonis TaxID=2807618 RepID=UPI0019619E53|nr:hypothetical protein [Parashewanella hymeniacidonis]MBM7070525.1 hypothetical protein [Parashewanella hymeniacidonis]